MPKCVNCNEHFKFEGDKVSWLIKEHIGDNVCSKCQKEYLEKTKRKVIGSHKAEELMD